jgi:hypothetical protein
MADHRQTHSRVDVHLFGINATVERGVNQAELNDGLNCCRLDHDRFRF